MNPYQAETFQLQDPSRQGKNLLRASLFTLLVVASDMDKAARCQQLVQVISKKFPCKVIFITLSTYHPENTLLINRSIMMTTNGGEGISCDLLTIEASHDELSRIPFLVVAEILADLPLFLLTAEPPFALPDSLHMLDAYIDKAIFEVNEIKNYSTYAKALIEYTKQTAVIDLNWVRLEPWRSSLSRLFHSESKLMHLHSIDKIEIRYIERKLKHGYNTELQAMLIQGWLASRLGWKTVSVKQKDERIIIEYRNSDEHIFSIQLLPSDCQFLEEGMVQSLEMTTKDDLHYLISYESDDRHIVVHSSSKDRCDIPFTFFVGNLQRGSTLPSELFQPGAYSHYLPVLQHLAQPEWEKIGKK